ncbi:hypothetical protein [Butyrivibrio sp. AE3009]|uniref:hypothetical protein n=1 Tax=Butyrivibrio sp. AE3009 TaxID=1280666 RepID=UPI0003B41065|nr:hypothetical protein [Butyrivibrio sp. AE3009]
MSIEIKKMETDDEFKGKAYVHWKGWQEAYTGIVDQGYLDGLTLEKCGFRSDGTEKEIELGAQIIEIRMVRKR